MGSGGAAVKMGGAQGNGLKIKIVAMNVPRRWLMRMWKGPGPEQSVMGESGYLEKSCDRYVSGIGSQGVTLGCWWTLSVCSSPQLAEYSVKIMI